MEIRAFLHGLLSARRRSATISYPAPMTRAWGLRDALLKCSTLSAEDVYAYIAYELEGIVYEDVPLDYDLDHPGEEFERLYADGVLQTKILLRHTNHIAPETLEKVQRVLPLLYFHPRQTNMF